MMKAPSFGVALAAISVCAGSVRALSCPHPAEPPSAPDVREQVLSDDQIWENLVSATAAVKAETKAGQDSVMRFTVPTEIRELLVTGGKAVKRGEVLVRARDADVAAALETQRFQATNDTEVKSAAAQRELADFRLERGRITKNLSASEEKELEIQSKVGGINVEAADSRFKIEQLKLKYYEGQYERYRLEAPFDGIISEVNVEAGQGVNDQNPVLRIVNIDRLKLDAWPRTDDTLRLKLREGSPAWVLLRGRDGWEQGKGWMQGTVMYVNPVADSVSQTRQVRVEVDNPEHFPAGTPALVRFVEPTKGAEGVATKGGRAAVAMPEGGSRGG